MTAKKLPSKTTLNLDARSALRAIRAVAPMRSLDECRQTLTDIHVAVAKGIATFYATDSYRMGVVEIEAGPKLSCTVDIPGEVVARLLRLMPTISPEPDDLLTITQMPGQLAYHTVILGVDRILLSAEVERTHPFPDCETLIPKKDADTLAVPVAFNPALLAPLKKFQREICGNGWAGINPVVVSTYGESKPALFTIDKPTFVISARMVLMPVRISS